MLKLEDGENKISIDELNSIESEMGVVFPEYFKDFYAYNNGGYLEANRVDVNGSIYSINGFNSFKYGKLTIEKLYGGLYTDCIELKGMVPFAYDDGGDMYLLSTKQSDYDHVYIWHMDPKELLFVSYSFRDFLGGFFFDE